MVSGFQQLKMEFTIYRTLAIQNYTPLEAIKVMQVFSSGDSILISNQKGDMEILDSRTRRNLWRMNVKTPVLSFILTKEKQLWFYGYNKIYFLDSSLNLKKVYTANANSFFEGPDGLIYSYGGGKLREFSKEGTLLQVTDIKEQYRSLFIHNSEFYYAGKTGLHIRNNKNELIKEPKEFSDYKISGFITLNDSTLIINTLGSGVILLNTNTWSYKQFNVENKFVANNIYTAIKKDNQLWLGTEAGILLLEINSLFGGTPIYQQWDKRNGLIRDHIKFLAVAHQNVWAFSDNGYSIIPKRYFSKNLKKTSNTFFEEHPCKR